MNGIGKFSSLKDEVIYRASLDGFGESIGSVDELGWHASTIEDFYGLDYVVIENSQGFVQVEKYEHIDIDDSGYFCPIERRVEELRAIESQALESDDDEV